MTLFSCTKKPLTENVLLEQLKGGRCSYFAEAPCVPMTKNYESHCYPVRWYHQVTTRNYASKCLQSAATCMLEIKDISPMAVRDVKEFIESLKSADVDSGAGNIPVRSNAAIVYARLAGQEAVPLLEEVLAASIGGADNAQKSDPKNTEALMKRAVNIAKGLEE